MVLKEASLCQAVLWHCHLGELLLLSPAALWQTLFPLYRKESRFWMGLLAGGSITREVSGVRADQGCCWRDPAVQQQPGHGVPTWTWPNSL